MNLGRWTDEGGCPYMGILAVGTIANLFLRTICGRMRGQNPERWRLGGYRDVSTPQGGASVFPASFSMTKGGDGTIHFLPVELVMLSGAVSGAKRDTPGGRSIPALA